MNSNRYEIHALVKTLSPLHIAAPGSRRYDPSSGRLTNVETGTLPCTEVQKLMLPTVRSTEDGRAFTDSVPIIAANNLNGRLRRHGARLTLNALAEKGEKVQMTTYSAVTCGAVTGSPDGGLVSFAEMREAREHPFVGLFGGGPRMMRRYVRVHNGIPLLAGLTDFMLEGLRHPSIPDTDWLPNNARITQAWAFRRNDDLRTLADMTTQSASITDYESQIKDYQKQLLKDRVAKDAGEESSRSSTFTYSAIEFVPPGVTFHTSFELDGTEEQLGLFLLSLDSFAETERLGGWSRDGFGRVIFNSVALIEKADTGDIVRDNIFHNGRLDRDHDAVRGRLEAWSAARANLSAARLDYLMRPPISKEEKKAQKEKVAA